MVQRKVLREVGYRCKEALFHKGIRLFIKNATKLCVEDIFPPYRAVFLWRGTYGSTRSYPFNVVREDCAVSAVAEKLQEEQDVIRAVTGNYRVETKLAIAVLFTCKNVLHEHIFEVVRVLERKKKCTVLTMLEGATRNY